jgi:hypothetical protein
MGVSSLHQEISRVPTEHFVFLKPRKLGYIRGVNLELGMKKATVAILEYFLMFDLIRKLTFANIQHNKQLPRNPGTQHSF